MLHVGGDDGLRVGLVRVLDNDTAIIIEDGTASLLNF